MASKVGKCKLCQRDGVTLQKSHFLPAGIYKILREDGEKNPNAVLLTGSKPVQTSWQMTAHLLCQDCEQSLSKNGETWVLKHCLRKEGFSLASILASRVPDVSSEGTPTRLYYASRIPEIDASALAYFAASMFWRASIHPWKDDGTIPVELGPFREQFRLYLMGQGFFPTDCSLWLAIREGKEIDRLTYAPIGSRVGNFHVYRFPMPGLAFSLIVSKNIPDAHREKCFVHGPGNPIFVNPISTNY